MMIQGFRRVARGVIQEKYNRRLTTMRHPSRRARNLKRYPRRSMWTLIAIDGVVMNGAKELVGV
jgi:hypothetical protein